MFAKKLTEIISIYLLTMTTSSLWEISLADVPRPRGVSLSNAPLYRPLAGETWRCLDNSNTIKFAQINDDFCDCFDGSDEPGTSACAKGTFHCSNRGHRSEDIPSSRVNDGICDCCDGSDEYIPEGSCPNSCIELGKVELERLKFEAETYRKGAAKRSEMIARSQQLKAEREKRRSELEARRQEQDSLKLEKEQLKKQAETAESEALEYFKQQQKEKEAAAAASAPEETLRSEATASFNHYDKNMDGFVEVTELQLDLQLDQDGNGIVTVEEAKYFLDERDRIDLEAFIALSWPRIKPMQMKAQGLFTPPDNEQNADEVAELVDEENRGDQKEEGKYIKIKMFFKCTAKTDDVS